MKLLRPLFLPWNAAFAFLIFLAAFTRLYHLGTTPAGISWDEAFLGYVGKMVVTTGRDEYGRLLPRVFESFGDYKAPLAVYLTGLFTSVLGLKPWVVRLPFALAGIGSVVLAVQLGTRVLSNRWLGLLTGWWLAIMPWHLLFSRVAFESGLALFFYLLTLVAWVESRSQSELEKKWLAAGAIGIVGGLYAYHSAKVVFPLALLAIAWHEWRYNRPWLRLHRPTLTRTGTMILALLIPLLLTVFFGKGGERASQTLVFSRGLGLTGTLIALAGGFLSHLSFQFLLFGQTDVLRHGTGMWGQLGILQFLFFLLGISYVLHVFLDQLTKRHWGLFESWRARFSRSVPSHSVQPWLWLALFLVGILPAALGFEIPHANRALLAVAPLCILMAYAAAQLRRGTKETAFSLIVGVGVLLSALEFANFWRFYHGPYRIRSSADWLQGYAQAVRISQVYRQEGKSIKFTDAYGQPAIFFGFYLDIPPQAYRAARVEGVTFGPISPEDFAQYDVLVAAPQESLPAIPAYEIQRADRSTAFLVYEKL